MAALSGRRVRRRLANPLSAALLAALSVATSFAQAPASPGAGVRSARWVIETGQESLVLAMLGGEAPVGGCHLENAEIPRDRIEATYSCGEGRPPVRVVLRHRPDAGCPTCTAKFAVEVPGDAPAGFADAVATVVRAGEGRFRWSHPIERSPRRRSVGWLVSRRVPVVVFVLLLSFLLIRAFVRSDDERRAEGADDPEPPPR